MKQTCFQVNHTYNQLIIPFRRTLGKQLLQLREDNDMTAYQVAKRLDCGISCEEIHDYEMGRYHIISFEMLLVLADFYRKKVRVVFEDIQK